jgi:CrcB protein
MTASAARELAAVVGGGAVGTGLRLAVDLLLPHADDGFPVATLLVNVVGAFALGLLVAQLWPIAAPWLRAGLGAGLLGSFTTFSALALSVVTLATTDQWMLALAYLVASVTLGLTAAALGLRAGHRRPPTSLDLVDE